MAVKKPDPEEGPKVPASIAKAQADAAKKYNTRVGPLNSIVDDVRAFSTGNIAIDRATGVGGIPRGRLCELYGLPSSGKSTTAFQAAVTLQRIILAGGDKELGIGPDDFILFVDFEQAVAGDYLEKLGLDTTHYSFLFTQPDTLEQGADIISEFVQTGHCRMLIVDSVAAMIPAAALEGDADRQAVAEQARALGRFIPKLKNYAANYDVAVLMLNHLVEQIQVGGRPGMPPSISTPGGKALKYYSSIRLEYRQAKTHTGEMTDELSGDKVTLPIATDVRVKVVKNKVAAPFKQALVRVRYGKGFDNFWTAFLILGHHRKITSLTGGYVCWDRVEGLSHPDMPVGTTPTAKVYNRPHTLGESGKPYALLDFADAHPEWRQMIIDYAEEIVAQLGAPEGLTPVGEADPDGDTDSPDEE